MQDTVYGELHWQSLNKVNAFYAAAGTAVPTMLGVVCTLISAKHFQQLLLMEERATTLRELSTIRWRRYFLIYVFS